MDEILAKINTLTEQIDKRFETMDRRLNDLEKGQTAIREDIKNSDDVFQLFELKTDHNFKKVMATQSDLKAELTSLRTHLFLEEGSREHAYTVSWDTQDKKWRALDKRLHAVEARLGLG